MILEASVFCQIYNETLRTECAVTFSLEHIPCHDIMELDFKNQTGEDGAKLSDPVQQASPGAGLRLDAFAIEFNHCLHHARVIGKVHISVARYVLK